MTTTLSAAQVELSKQLGDYWASTSTSAGAADFTTIVDTALIAKENDWIGYDMYDLITEAAHATLSEERKISSLSNTLGTLTVLAHSAQIGSGVDYEVHRLFTASEKRRALINAAKLSYPALHKEIRDENKTVGNWLLNGDMEQWAVSTAPDNWTVYYSTAAQNTTAPYYTRGASSCKLTTASGWMEQTDTLVPDLRELSGKTVTFKAKVWCDTASCARLNISSIGATGTGVDEYSDYHPGSSRFCDGDGEDEFLEVTATIPEGPQYVKFKVYHAVAAGTTYVDDLRVIGPQRDKVYIGDLGLAQDRPYRVYQSSDSNIFSEPWALLRDAVVGSDNYLRCGNWTSNYRLRIVGIGYLDFLASGAVSTAWTATIAVDSPQLEILVAEAAKYLCRQKILPTDNKGVTDRWKMAYDYWAIECIERRRRFGMHLPPITINYGSG